MSAALRSAYQLVDEMLDKGLPFVASYLEKMIHRPVVITDEKGLIHYPDLPFDESFYDVVHAFSSAENCYYSEPEKRLFYPVDYSGGTAWIIVSGIPQKMVRNTLAMLEEARLAIKCYFSHNQRLDNDHSFFSSKLVGYLFSNNDENVADIIKLVDHKWNINSPCYAAIFRADDDNEAVDWTEVYRYSLSYFKRFHLETVLLLGPKCLIALWPDRIICKVDDRDGELFQLASYSQDIRSRFALRCSVGIGRPYPISHVRRSFQEARIASIVPSLMGQKEYTQHFRGLGFLSHIFSADADSLKGYCYGTLGKVLEHDSSNQGELMTTLRQLLGTSFNCRATADRLFIHINTLYYRMNKIQELLGTDLAQMDTRVNLYTAVIVWDTLQQLYQ